MVERPGKRAGPVVDRVFDLSGGALCLDFANTLGDRPRSTQEHLRSYADLLAWSRQAGALDAERARSLAERSVRRPGEASAVLERAIELREALYRIFSALAAGRPAPRRELSALNRGLRDALPWLRVVDGPAGLSWSWAGPSGRLDRMLWPVMRSAARLLTSEEVQFVRECASDRCSWLFVDRSRSRRRRWCDMKTCGNRQKARRHYRRKKAARSEAAR